MVRKALKASHQTGTSLPAVVERPTVPVPARRVPADETAETETIG